MICFRDMTFCASDCENVKCPRHFGPDDQAASREWWGGADAPVAFSDFSHNCPDYKPPNDSEPRG